MNGGKSTRVIKIAISKMDLVDFSQITCLEDLDKLEKELDIQEVCVTH